MNLYRSPYEAYPFLSDDITDLRCDFELLTDELSSATGYLITQVEEENLKDELLWICEIIYHLNPTLRTRLTVTEDEIRRLADAVERLKRENGERVHVFVLPRGCASACLAHMLRVKGKCLVRLVYRYLRQGHEVSPLLLDACNLVSEYFFALALKLNALSDTREIPFISRNY